MMDNKCNTRHRSKKQGEDDFTGLNLKGKDKEEDSQNIHSCVNPCPEPLSTEDFNKWTTEEKMENMFAVVNQLCTKVIEMDININHDSDGINTKLQTISTQVDSNTTYSNTLTTGATTMKSSIADLGKKLNEAHESIEQLKSDNVILKGCIQKQNQQLKTLNDKVAMVTAKSMEKNITISGLEGDSAKENCKEKVVTFLKEKVEIDAELAEIFVAHRIDKKVNENGKPRLMLVRLNMDLKQRIFKNIRNLKDKTNSRDELYYINKQLPEQLVEQNREIKELIKQQKSKDSQLNPRDRSTIEVINKKVYVDGEPIQKDIPQLEINDLFPDKVEKDKQDKIRFTSSDTITEEGSSFTAMAIKTGQIHEVCRAYRRLYRLNPAATHIIAAYNLRSHRGYQEDNEFAAGHKILSTLEKHQCNTAVFMIRTYGGTQLGPRRFELMKEVVLQALDRVGINKI